jgi:UDPglucose 6-dehydrogenase
VIVFALDVATNDANESDLEPLKALIEKVSRVTEGAVLVITAQVPPGFCRTLATRFGGGSRLFYQVETLVFGNAIERAVCPERFIIGCMDAKGLLPGIYRRYLEAFGCPVLAMRYESAELCKIAINFFLVSSVTTSNMLSEICEKIGANWQEVIPALRLDRRIGPHAYLQPGLGIAGGNLERDMVAVQRLASENGCDAGVVTAWQRDSLYRRDWVLRRLYGLGLLEDPGAQLFGLWGLAYKQDTHSTRNAASLALLRCLPQYHWLAYDPAASIEHAEFPSVRVCVSALESVRGVDALVVMTPWRIFSDIDMHQVRAAMGGRVVLDPYGVLDSNKCRELGLAYYQLGL